MSHEIKVFDPSQLEKKAGVVVGTRPSIVMFAPIIHELRRRNIPHFVVHTGQHYSPNMDTQFFSDLELPPPDYKLDNVAAKKTHGAQTAAMLEGMEAVFIKERPKIVLVGGDANTNLAGALAARKLRIKIGHVESGERSFDWRMPEEHNRRMIDHISEHLFATGEKGKSHLLHESVRGEIHIVGNPIVDASLQHVDLAKNKSAVLSRFGLQPGGYALLTTHREENVDFSGRLRGALEGVSQASALLQVPVIFLAHPRTLKRLKEFEMLEWAKSLNGIQLHEAVGYLDFLNLIAQAKLVFTDSGGVQQESCILGVPCVTLRDNTEWVETLELGANALAGVVPEVIVEKTQEMLQTKRGWDNPFGDGQTAKRIADVVVSEIVS